MLQTEQSDSETVNSFNGSNKSHIALEHDNSGLDKQYSGSSSEAEEKPLQKRIAKKFTNKSKIKSKAVKIKPKRQKKEREICPICGVLVLSLDNHTKLIHTERVYDHECEPCSRRFFSKARLQEHFRMVHINKR